jgi:cell wall-associated NlpC family hydrolase
VIEDIHAALGRVLAERGLDWRTCFAEVRCHPPEGHRIVVESSDPGVLADTARRLAESARGAETAVEFAALPDAKEAFPEVLIASGSVADVRRSPSHAAELVTQLVCGDRVSPLKSNGDWVLVRLDDPYIGWVRSWHLKGLVRSDYDGFAAAARHRVAENVVSVRETPDERGRAVGEAVVGTPVIAAAGPRRGWSRVELPDGTAGFLKKRSIGRIPAARRVSREKLVASAMSFLGIPYVWGGNTPKGFDCSGLVQRAFRLNGVLIPRDSDQQAHAGRGKEAGRHDELRTADLLFFGKSVNQITHVGMYASDGIFVHAHGQVRLNSVVPGHSLFDERLASEWRVTRDLFPT